MSTITTEQVKELRDKTGISIMQCRKALEEANGDMEKALIILQKKGGEAAQKKSDRSAADGIVVMRTDGSRVVTLVLNCETDFVAKNDDFVNLADALLALAWEQGVEKMQEAAPEMINAVVLKTGENIQLGGAEDLKGEVVGNYTHFDKKSAAAVVLKGGTPEVAKDIAMHVAAMKPSFLSSADISAEQKDKVKAVMEEEVAQSDKPQEIKDKMLEGKINSFFAEQTLLNQPFFKAPEKTIEQYAKENGATVDTFVLYTVGA
ncbi:MAG TPA: translation elongation factor Ts [Candidatus Paceibacterota bacterium]|jgi:elongation factor Ts|nr:translation elongation factor Ts [Candidatus Paceibacterota bacterium]